VKAEIEEINCFLRSEAEWKKLKASENDGPKLNAVHDIKHEMEGIP